MLNLGWAHLEPPLGYAGSTAVGRTVPGVGKFVRIQALLL